jgi:hypothetical protein
MQGPRAEDCAGTFPIADCAAAAIECFAIPVAVNPAAGSPTAIAAVDTATANAAFSQLVMPVARL